MNKQSIFYIHEKNKITDSIIRVISEKNNFIVIGHKNPDEDCVASMVAVSLILVKFYKKASIYIVDKVHENLDYLLKIARYNSIQIIDDPAWTEKDIGAVIACDTPKGSMLALNPRIKELILSKRVPVIEIDHHIGADSKYIGDEGLRLVTEASSASELIGFLALKLSKRSELLAEYGNVEIFTRNLVLSILTGIVGDSKMGKYIKSRREQRFYGIYSCMYNNILGRETVKNTNLFDIAQVFEEIQKLSRDEAGCFEFFKSRIVFEGGMGYAFVDDNGMAELRNRFADDTIITTVRSVADTLAEKAGSLSLVAYDDSDGPSGFVQFRIRRGQNYKDVDVREFIEMLSIKNGGGHEGAIGFRISRSECGDPADFFHKVKDAVIARIHRLII